MLQLDLQNCFNLSSAHGLAETEFRNSEKNIESLLTKIKQRGQGFYEVIDDQAMIDEVVAFAESVKGQYTDIAICGIGGSALGPITLRDAFTSSLEDSSPKLHVLENIDPDFLGEALAHFNLSSTLFLVVSKSGGTPETLAQYMFFRNEVDKAGLDPADHFVFVTDPEKSLLLEVSKKEGIRTFPIASNVGGRFSVQTPVGLLPAALIGVDIKELIKGMQDMRDSFLNTNFDQNIPFQLSVVQIGASEKGKSQNIIMPYHTKLRQFGAWCVQLIAESTGKFKPDGTSVGITPIPSLGVTDQHSQVQLFAEGPNDKLIVFIKVETFSQDLEIPVLIDHEKTNFMSGKSFKDLLHAEQQATADALTENDRPNITITIPELTPYYLGQLFMLFEGATAFLGEFFEIDAFNQPGVERGKVLTREILAQS